MLLRSLTKHVRTQNWYAIGIDFIVVVVGIFVGLQADAWNEARKDKVRERVYLEQLYTDFEYNADRLTRVAEEHAELIEELIFAVGVVLRGEIATDEVERFKWIILTMSNFMPSRVTTGGYDAIIASGDFAILQDQDLKTSLVQIHATLKYEDIFLKEFRDDGKWPDAVTEKAVKMVPHPSGRGGQWVVDFDALKEYPRTLAILANSRRTHAIWQDQYLGLADKFTKLHHSVGQLLGKDRASASK